jgi:hypothetical protein
MATSDLIGSSPKFRAVLDEINMVAPVNCTVLVRGETGTGKEVIAQAIHEASPRRSSRFVALNCAAIPSALLESELFGYERGAFTGAITQTMGRFQAADRGTLFLDEIGDLPLELQPKLLRVLQEQQFERLGGNRTFQVDVRLIAATNQDLWQMVQEKKFRADLYYRLNVFPITLPPPYSGCPGRPSWQGCADSGSRATGFDRWTVSDWHVHHQRPVRIVSLTGRGPTRRRSTTILSPLPPLVPLTFEDSAPAASGQRHGTQQPV